MNDTNLFADLVIHEQTARDTYQFAGIEANSMGSLAAAINRWLLDHPGWAVRSVQHSVAIAGDALDQVATRSIRDSTRKVLPLPLREGVGGGGR